MLGSRLIRSNHSDVGFGDQTFFGRLAGRFFFFSLGATFFDIYNSNKEVGSCWNPQGSSRMIGKIQRSKDAWAPWALDVPSGRVLLCRIV